MHETGTQNNLSGDHHIHTTNLQTQFKFSAMTPFKPTP